MQEVRRRLTYEEIKALNLPPSKYNNFHYLKHMTEPINNTTLVLVENLLSSFSPETCTRKQIKELRKALSALKNEKFPRRAKVKRVKAVTAVTKKHVSSAKLEV